jgi:hypothetical protein
MVRSARDGQLTISDANGHLVAEAPSSTDHIVLTVATRPLTSRQVELALVCLRAGASGRRHRPG